MTDIVAFLTARLDEREQYARRAEHAVGTKYDPLVFSGCETVSIPLMELYRDAYPTQVLRDVAAKQEILGEWRRAAEDHYRDGCDEAAGAAWATMMRVLVLLAGAYQSHSDYAGDGIDDWTWPDEDPAWRPE